ncbi:PiggyBac transposable element-derived protein 4 [Elysia marginata]|uniref:PiggyBac transposable element-derived protein 4 n=1 Tax=Elysia marginata TaxID=1093978 RepID=A0AAV4J3A7_9GAST|nr:PiggyBac transposable element-derived protein 4 [Elysia marginata]
MSTMHHDDSFDIECRKPEMVMSYNATKGGVDTMDQMCHALTTKRKTNRWPMLLFYNLLDLASIASLVVWRKLNPNDKVSGEDDRVLFNLATAKELVLPRLERRQAQTNLSRNLRYTNTALKDVRAQTQPAEEASVSTAFAPGKRTTRQQCAVLCAKALCAQSMRKSNLSASHANNRVQAENKVEKNWRILTRNVQKSVLVGNEEEEEEQQMLLLLMMLNLKEIKKRC